MMEQKIAKNWVMKKVGTDVVYPATVPGTVYTDLLEYGLMEDPYYRDNELKALKIIEDDYEYSTEFDVEEDFFQRDEVLLCFEKIDTVADIYLNDALLGSVCNMHRSWEYSVADKLKKEGNTLRIILHSPTRYIKEYYAKDPVEGSREAMVGFPGLRKAHCMFGWDWGPRIPDAGILGEVKLVGVQKARFSSVYVRQEHLEDMVNLRVEAKIKEAKSEREYELCEAKGDVCLLLTVTDPQGKVLADKVRNPEEISLVQPRLWWPRGYGAQPLYTVRAELWCEGACVDVWEKRVGLRTMEVSREKDSYGEEFAHMVNGVKIFAMGADYIPQDNILSRVNARRTRALLEQCVAANFNCIRVWGGGYYPEDFFYDICDELGLVVWQDFMFACAVYHLTEEFEENIRVEIAENVRRLRHHASLGLWCGNNEMEMFVDEGMWGAKFQLKSDYVKMYEYIIPKILKKEDPQTFYWPASPSSGGGFDSPNDENRGDVHYWDVWHGNKPFTEYRKFHFRYLSEFGFQSFPSVKTIETFTEPEDRNIFSYVMEKHQRNASANGKIMNYMEQTFLYPESLDKLVYYSQLLQAESVRYGVEHFRRNRGRCMGTVYWQLNDCWPVASWSSIDYYGRWKALHYYAKRFFAPLLLSCEEEGLLSQSMDVNEEPFEVKKSIRLNVVNESMTDRMVTVKWQLRNASAEILQESEEQLRVKALSAIWLDKVEMEHARLYSDYVSYQLWEQGECVSEGTVLFCQPKHFRFADPHLKVRAEGDEIIVSADAYARSVEVRNAADDLILSDNFFDMNGGEKRIKVLKGVCDELAVRCVYK